MKIEKDKKIVCSLYGKKDYAVYIRTLKQILNHRLILQKSTKINYIKLKAWLEPNIDMNIELQTKAKNFFEKYFCKLMSNLVFQKDMENVGKHRHMERVITERKRNHLVSERSYHLTKGFQEIC